MQKILTIIPAIFIAAAVVVGVLLLSVRDPGLSSQELYEQYLAEKEIAEPWPTNNQDGE